MFSVRYASSSLLSFLKREKVGAWDHVLCPSVRQIHRHEQTSLYMYVEGIGKGRPWHAWTGTEGSGRYSSNPFATSALEGDGWSAPLPDRFATGKDPVLRVQEVGWASGPVWTAGKISPSPGFDPRTVQPYRLRYPGGVYIYMCVSL
jgi:hypothetical protein